jgi:hypothetical protein
MTPEAKVANRVKAKCKEFGLKAIRNHKGKGAEVGWPDFFVLGPNRHMLGVETKARTGKPTRIQQERAREMAAYGFAWCAPKTVDDVDFTLQNFALFCIGERPLDRKEFDQQKAQ